MPQVKRAIIEDVLNEKPYDGNPKAGRIWYYTIVLDNGDRGEIGTKTRDAFSVNDELYYTIEESNYGPKIKKASPEQVAEYNGNGSQPRNDSPSEHSPKAQQFVNSFKGGNRGSDASFALSYAKDFIGKAMEVKTRDATAVDDPVSVNQWVAAVLVTAEKFNQFLKENAQ